MVNNTLRRYRLTHPIRVTSWPPKGDTTGRGRGDALVRSTKLVAGLENGTVRIAAYVPTLEEQAVRWQGTQHQPDRIAALTVAHDVLVHSIGHMHIVSMADIERRAREGRMPPPPAWMRRRIGG